MSRRNLIFAMAVVALVVAGAIVSATQGERFGERDGAGEEPPVSETLVVIQDCPYGEASCILGQGIERALQRGNVDAVMQFGVPRFYVCPGPGRSDAPSPLCDRVGADEGRVGYPVSHGDSGPSVVEPAVLRERLLAFVDAARPEAEDAVGDGTVRLYAFSCTEAAFPAQHVSCAKEGIVLSAILEAEQGTRREVLIFWAQGGFAGRTLPFTEVWQREVGDWEEAILFGTGGELPDLGVVDPIDQSLPR